MAIIIKKTKNDKCWQECGIYMEGAFIHCWWEYKSSQLLWDVWRSFKKLKINLLYDPDAPFLSIDPKESKSSDYRDTWTSMFTATLFTTAKLWNQPRCLSTDE
jgi:hypothetical protein